jgi:hypothetical protein
MPSVACGPVDGDLSRIESVDTGESAEQALAHIRDDLS